MTKPYSQDVREIIFVNEAARKAFVMLPSEVRDQAQAALSALQNNQRLPPGRLDELGGKQLKGVSEIRIPWDSDEYRTYQVATYREVIYVLDAGMKKSPRGGEIPRPQIERLIERRAQAETDYERRRPELQARYEARARARGEAPTTLTPGGKK